jgi:hypothetical protein
MNCCFRVYDNLFGKKEEKREEEKAKVEIREPPKKDYKRKYLGHFAVIVSLTPSAVHFPSYIMTSQHELKECDLFSLIYFVSRHCGIPIVHVMTCAALVTVHTFAIRSLHGHGHRCSLGGGG